MHIVYKVLIELGFIRVKQNKALDYTSEENGQFDLNHFLNNQPHWEHICGEVNREHFFKTIIINDLQIHRNGDYFDLCIGLKALGFNVILRHAKNQFLELKTEKDLEYFRYIKNEALLQELISLQVNPNDYVILDYPSCTHLNILSNIKQGFPTIESSFLVKGHKVDEYVDWFCHSQCPIINFKTSVDDSQNYIEWKNNFNKEELTTLLTALKDDDALTLNYFLQHPNLEEFYVEPWKGYKSIDVAVVPQVKKLYLEETYPENLNYLTSLKELFVNVDINFDFAACPKLEKLTFQMQSSKSKITYSNIESLCNSKLKKIKFHREIDEGRRPRSCTLNKLGQIIAIELDVAMINKLINISHKSNTLLLNANTLNIALNSSSLKIPEFFPRPFDFSEFKEITIQVGKDTPSLDISVDLPQLKKFSLKMYNEERAMGRFTIKGLALCKNIQEISLENAQIVDSLPLSCKSLTIHHSTLSSLNFKDYANLESLDICYDKSLEDLRLPSQLKRLYARDKTAEFIPISTLRELPNLIKLYLGNKYFEAFAIAQQYLPEPFVQLPCHLPLISTPSAITIQKNNENTDSIELNFLKNLFTYTSKNDSEDDEDDEDDYQKEKQYYYHPAAFNFNTRTNPDKMTKVKRTFLNNTNFSKERQKVSDRLIYDDKSGIVLKSSVHQFTPVAQFAVPNHKELARDRVNIKKGENYILRGLSASDEICYFQNDNFIVVKNQYQQYALQLANKAIELFNGVVEYAVNTNKKYFYDEEQLPPPIGTLAKQDIPLLLDEQLINFMHEMHKNYFHQLFDINQDKNSLFQQIIQYCRWGSGNKSIKSNGNFWMKLKEMMIEKSGSCLHRSIIAKLLCDYYSYLKGSGENYIPIRLVENDCHMFLEVFTDKNEWVGICLGGHPCQIVANQIPILNQAKLIQIQPSNSTVLSANDWEERFLNQHQWVNDLTEFSQFGTQVIKSPKQILLRTANREQEMQCYDAFVKYAKEINRPFVYVDNASEFKRPVAIGQNSNEGFISVNGPLHELIENKGEGIILINWTNLSDRERAIYKCLIDKPPTFNGKRLPESIRIVGLLNNEITPSDVFLSRSISIPCPTHLLKERTLSNNNPVTSSIDVHQANDWIETLLYSVTFKDGFPIVTNGKLVAAMEKGEPIEIVNPPIDDDYFELIKARLEIEGKLFVNGKVLTAKPGFELRIRQQQNNLKNLRQAREELPIYKNGKKYYINRNTFKQFIQTTQIRADGSLHTLPGMVDTFTEDDQFILTEGLTEAELAKLEAIIKKLASNPAQKSLDLRFYQLVKDAVVPSIQSLSEALEKTSFNNVHVQSRDPHFTVHELQKLVDVSTSNIFYLSGKNTWNELIQISKLKLVGNRLVGERKVCAFLNKLMIGETVILAGDLKYEDQNLLQSLFAEKPYFIVNGERIEITGRLFWVSQKQLSCTPLTQAIADCTPKITDYYAMLKQDLNEMAQKKNKRQMFKELNSIDEDICGRLNQLFTCFYYLPKNGCHFNYEKYRLFYFKLMNKPETGNPLKSMLTYHFTQGTEEYAYINVLAKIFFADTSEVFVRKDALDAIVQEIIASANPESAYDHATWRIVNCFSGEAIRRLFAIKMESLIASPGGDKVPKLTDDVRLRISQYLEIQNSLPLANKKQRIRDRKQHLRLQEAIMDETKNLIYLVGDAGTGKTYSVYQFAKENDKVVLHNFNDPIQLAEWSNAKEDGKIHLLLIDEANLAENGAYEFLRGLKNNPPVIYYQGQPILLHSNQKVIMTGNPLYYLGRHFHDVIWDHAHVIWYKNASVEFINGLIESHLQLPIAETDKQAIVQLTKNIYQSLQNNKLRIENISLRDIKNVIERITLYIKQKPAANTLECCKIAIYHEFHGLLANDEAREQLLNELNMQSTKGVAKKINNGFIVTAEKSFLMENILADIQLRKTNPHIKRGILIEGASGIGKSTFLLETLESNGYRLNHDNPTMRYYQITAGNEDVMKFLREAVKNGSKVILDELNVDESVKEYLLQVLDNNNNDVNPEFMLFTTQNPAYTKGCDESAKELNNRLHKIIMNDYSREELVFIAQNKGIQQSVQIVNGFFSARERKPLEINTRNCFEVIDQMANGA